MSVDVRKYIEIESQGHRARAASRSSLPQRKSLKSKLSRYEALRSFTATNFLLRSGQCALHSKLCLESFFIFCVLLSLRWKLELFRLNLKTRFTKLILCVIENYCYVSPSPSLSSNVLFCFAQVWDDFFVKKHFY